MRAHIKDVLEGHSHTALLIHCPSCGRARILVTKTEEWKLWCAGVVGQRAFPTLKADDREAIISGLCKRCYPC